MKVDVINAFTLGTTYEALIHVLEREAPRMTWELLDVTTKYTMGEGIILANFTAKA